jgi:putative PIN family toxin of toxin-antitoxin system
MSYQIVVDTNVIISSVLTPGGKPDQLFMAVFEGQLQLILSKAILQEARRVFSYHKIQKLLDRRGVTTEDIEDFLIKLIKISTLVSPISRPDIIIDDPVDNSILATALDGQANFIVSGDQHLIALKEYKGIPILTPAEAIEEIIDRT